MARIILLMEFLVSGGLLWALGCAIAAKTKYSLLRNLFRLGWGLVLILPWVAACGSMLLMYINVGNSSPVYFGICATVSLIFLISVCVITAFGRKQKSLMHTPAAALWPKLKLLKYSLGALILTAATVWNYDINIRQSMTLMRLEAQTQAMNLLPAKVPETQNAATYYNIAYDLLDKQNGPFKKWRDEVSDWLGTIDNEFDPNNEKMLSFLAENKIAIEYLHRAASLKECYWPCSSPYNSLESKIQNFGRIKATARLLNLAALVDIEQNRFEDAARNISAMTTIAEHTASDPSLISGLVAIACNALSFDAYKELIEDCPISNPQLQKFNPNKLFSYEKVFLKNIQMEQQYAKSLYAGTPMDGMNFEEISPALSAAYRVFFWKEDFDAYRKKTKDYIQYAQKPYYESKPLWDKATAKAQKNFGGFLASLLGPSYAGSSALFARAQACSNLMILTKCINEYTLAEGKLPENLSQLSPNYIPVQPVDPFSGENYKLIQDDATMTIYSVGPDMIDDSGSEFDWETKKGDIALKLRKN